MKAIKGYDFGQLNASTQIYAAQYNFCPSTLAHVSAAAEAVESLPRSAPWL